MTVEIAKPFPFHIKNSFSTFELLCKLPKDINRSCNCPMFFYIYTM